MIAVGSSVPAALDYLERQIKTLPVVEELAASVTLGWPSERRDAMVVLAATSDDDDVRTSQEYADLSGDENETVTVVSTIRVKRVGEGMFLQAAGDAHRILDAIRELIRADRKLGGSVVPGMPARITTSAMGVTRTTKEAGQGRAVDLMWTLTWTNRTGA